MSIEEGGITYVVDKDGDTFTHWQLASEWRAKRGCRLFPTMGSWTWFERLNREALLKNNALLVIRGRKHVNVKRIEPICLTILKQKQ